MNPALMLQSDRQLDDEEYQSLLRALSWAEGFDLLFVECSPAQASQLIAQTRADLPHKNIDVLSLAEPIDNLYQIVADLPDGDSLNILFIQGIEKSLVDYIKPGVGGQGDYYKEDTLPPILNHLNLQRERFRDSFNICFVFLLARFALKYFIFRAPDFFDWRSGSLTFPPDRDGLEQELSRLRVSQPEDGSDLTAAECKNRIFQMNALLEAGTLEPAQQADVLALQAVLLIEIGEFQAAVAGCDRALHLHPEHAPAWKNRGWALYNLDRDEEAIASYDKALAIQPNDSKTWNRRGLALRYLGRYEEAIASYDKALEIKSHDCEIWYHRGLALYYSDKYEKAIDSYDRTLKIEPNFYLAWLNRGRSLRALSRYEDAISSYDKALEINPELSQAWDARGLIFRILGHYEEAIFSYNRALEINPGDSQIQLYKSYALSHLGLYQEATSSLDKAIEYNPESYILWHYRAYSLYYSGQYEEAVYSYDKAIEVMKLKNHYSWGWRSTITLDSDPSYLAWYGRSLSLCRLGRYQEAILSFKQFLATPDLYKDSFKLISFIIKAATKAVVRGKLSWEGIISGFAYVLENIGLRPYPAKQTTKPFND